MHFQLFKACILILFAHNLIAQSASLIKSTDSPDYPSFRQSPKSIHEIIEQFSVAESYIKKSDYIKGLTISGEARSLAQAIKFDAGEGYYLHNLSIFHRFNSNSFALDLAQVYKDKSIFLIEKTGFKINETEPSNVEVNWKNERIKLTLALDQLDSEIWKEEIANVQYSLEYNYLKSGVPDSAIFFGNKAISAFTLVNNPEGLFCTTIDLMNAYHNSGKTKEAIELELRALKIITETPSKAIQGNLYELLAIRYDEMRRYSAIINCLLKANEIWRVTKNKKKLAKNLILLGTYYTIANGDIKTAYGFLKEALKIKDEIADSENIHELYTNLIQKANAEKDFVSADRFITEARSRLGNSPDAFSLGRLTDAEGHVLMSKKNYAEARQKFEKSISYFNQDENIIFKSYSLLNLSECLKAMGLFDLALKNALLSYTISNTLSWNDVKKSSSLLLSELYKLRGNLPDALQYLEIHNVVQNEINAINDKNKIKEMELEKLVEIKKREQEEDLIQLNHEIEKQRRLKQYSILIFTGILSIGIVVFYNQYKTLKLKQANLALESQIKAQETVLTERTRISRELHDEVGSTLSGISMYSHLVNHQIENSPKEEVVKSLGIMRNSAGEVISKLNDIIWLTNPSEDSFEKLVLRLQDYANVMALPKGIKIDFHVDHSIYTFSSPPETRHNLYLICKESINNIIKYSQATKLKLEIKKTDTSLFISIKDNGIGFDLNNTKLGNGLINLKKRAEGIHANLEILTSPGNGCEIQIFVNIK